MIKTSRDSSVLPSVILLASLVAGCSKPESGYSTSPSRYEAALVEGNAAFASGFYQRLKNEPGNICLSPYSISSSLAALYAGARGQTEEEIAKTMHFTLSQAELHPAFRAVTASVQGAQRPGVELALACSLWCNKDEPLEGGYVSLLRDDYGGAPRRADFSDPSAAAGELNAWLSERTKGKVQSLVEPGQVAENTRLVLCSTIYFKGAWATQFDKKATRPATFYVGAKQTVATQTMQAESRFKTSRADGLSLLELPYAGKTLSMIVLLPADYEGLPGMEQQLTPANLRAWLHGLKSASGQKCRVLLPRLKLAQRLDLSSHLAAMGMPSVFSRNRSDLSGVGAATNLFVASVLHHATLDVDEEGTEAAAATATHLRTTAQPPTFMVDHPFIFMIIENRTSSILFLGRVLDPSRP